MMINKFAKVISAATVLAMTVSLAPESALAQRFSGGANNQFDRLEFDLNTSAPYTGGTFSGAIQNAIYTDNDPFLDFNKSGIPKGYQLNQGDLKVSLENISDSLQNALNNPQSGSFAGKFGSTVVKYEADLEDNSNPKNFVSFVFYAPYINPFTNLDSLSVFNASNLNPFLDPQGEVSFPKYITQLNQLNSDFFLNFLLLMVRNFT
ncbi:MAG: hypothetical protein KME30_23905 [Iphinoe sp. HA4291-MV1]|nr:hypothetical protein [Iphinoe sp. HA4291-MV1]